MDETFDRFMADLLSFESGYVTSQLAHYYANALQQYRLGIKQGGLGLTQAVLIAPAANYVALRDFYCWYSDQTGLIVPFIIPTGSPLFQLPHKP